MITGLRRYLKRYIFRYGLFFLLSAKVIGLDVFPIPSQTVRKETGPTSLAVSFMTSYATLNYQGRQGQNRAQTVSLAMIERQTSSNEATYALSGAGGFRIGKDGMAVFYNMSPVTIAGDLAKTRLASSDKRMDLWLHVINGTLSRLAHKHMASGTWNETINLSLGNMFPETIHAQFSARPLPAPDNKWILITADSGVVSFSALDEEYQKFDLSGRYRGILVYSPTEDEFRQASETFTLYHGQDQFRIEQLHYAADAEGNQIYPVLDVGSYLDFKPEAPIGRQILFPPWCVQAARVFDMLHLAMMTAAEGSTNWAAVTMMDNSLLDWIYREAKEIAIILGRTVADKWLSTWIDLLLFTLQAYKEGPIEAIRQAAFDFVYDKYQAALEFAADKIFKQVGLATRIRIFQKILLSSAVAALEANMDLVRYQVGTLTPFPAEPSLQTPPSGPPAKPASQPPETPEPPPAEPKSPGKGKGGVNKALLLGGIGAAGLLTYILITGGCPPGKAPCGNTGVCCPDLDWYDPASGNCFSGIYYGMGSDLIKCHRSTLTFTRQK